MKKILIVEVPEGYNLSVASVAAFKNEWDGAKETFCKFNEFTPPSDEEIVKAANNPDVLHPFNVPKPAFRIGAKYILSLLQ